MLTRFGTSITCVPPWSVTGTVNVSALLQIPFCWTFTTPVTAFEATLAMIVVSFQPLTTPGILPIQTTPFPWLFPNPFPEIVIGAPGPPDAGLISRMCGVFIVNGRELLQMPACSTCTAPDAEPPPTVA